MGRGLDRMDIYANYRAQGGGRVSKRSLFRFWRIVGLIDVSRRWDRRRDERMININGEIVRKESMRS